MPPRLWLMRQANGTFFVLAFAAYALLGSATHLVLFGGPLAPHLPGIFGGCLALAYVTMLGRQQQE